MNGFFLNLELEFKVQVYLSQTYLIIWLSVKNTWFKGWDHVLDINKGILSSVHFEELKSLLDKITKGQSFSLAVINSVSHIQIFSFEQVHDW